MTNLLSQETLKINMDEPIDDFILHMSKYCNFSYEALKEFDDTIRKNYLSSATMPCDKHGNIL